MFRIFLLALLAITQLALTPSLAAAASGAARPQPAACHAQVLPGSWAIDGVFGPYTELAVRRFQRARGLVVDGIAGPRTLSALGWQNPRHVLRCGMSSLAVLTMQEGLSRAHFWRLDVPRLLAAQRPAAAPRPRVAAKPRPTPRATPTPLPSPSASPVAARPSPAAASPTPRPVASPRPTPAATPSAAPTATPGEVRVPLPPDAFVTREPLGPSLIEATGGVWFNTLPLPTGSDVVFAAAQPSWNGRLAMWRGNWGLGADLVGYNPAIASAPAMRFYQPGTWLWDAGLKYRFGEGREVLGLGYRRLTQNNLDFVTLALSSRRPLAGEWLWLQAGGLTGGNTSGAYTYDLHTTLGLQLRPFELGLGYRLMTISRLSANEPVYITSGPTLGLKVGF